MAEYNWTTNSYWYGVERKNSVVTPYYVNTHSIATLNEKYNGAGTFAVMDPYTLWEFNVANSNTASITAFKSCYPNAGWKNSTNDWPPHPWNYDDSSYPRAYLLAGWLPQFRQWNYFISTAKEFKFTCTEASGLKVYQKATSSSSWTEYPGDGLKANGVSPRRIIMCVQAGGGGGNNYYAGGSGAMMPMVLNTEVCIKNNYYWHVVFSFTGQAARGTTGSGGTGCSAYVYLRDSNNNIICNAGYVTGGYGASQSAGGNGGTCYMNPKSATSGCGDYDCFTAGTGASNYTGTGYWWTMFSYWTAKGAMNRIYTAESTIARWHNGGYNGLKAGNGSDGIWWNGWPLSCMAQKDAWHVPSTSNYTLLDYNSTYACYNDDATKGAPSYFATGYGIGYGCGGNRYTGGNVGCVKIFY